MKQFPEKVREARRLLKLTQEDLGHLVGISKRAIVAYESEDVFPRPKVRRKLADALKVSVDYLEHDEIEDPTYGLEIPEYIEETKERFNNKAAEEIEFLLTRNTALFFGNTIDQDAKDAFFAAVTMSYWTHKEEARKTFRRQNKDQ